MKNKQMIDILLSNQYKLFKYESYIFFSSMNYPMKFYLRVSHPISQIIIPIEDKLTHYLIWSIL